MRAAIVSAVFERGTLTVCGRRTSLPASTAEKNLEIFLGNQFSICVTSFKRNVVYKRNCKLVLGHFYPEMSGSGSEVLPRLCYS